jgi:hypothetical protein
MTGRQSFIILCGLLAAAAAAVFFAIAIDRHIYAPGAPHLHRGGELARLRHHVPGPWRREFSPAFILRKAYSIGAFAIVGFLAAPTLPRARRVVLCALLVACFSLAIEVAQKIVFGSESLASNAFDVACGALGGLIGAGAWNVVAAFAGSRRTIR